MSGDVDQQSDRDGYLTRRMCHSADSLGYYFRTWIEEEMRDLTGRAEALEITTLDGAAKGQFEEIVASIDDVRSHEQEAFQRLDERIKEIEGMLYSDPLESYQHLQDSLSGMERLVRRLLAVRRQVDDLWTPPG
jgi:hypothetical protein